MPRISRTVAGLRFPSYLRDRRNATYPAALVEAQKLEAAVKLRFFHRKIRPENLGPIGYGKTQLKNGAADPYAGENRYVQIVNTEMK